MSNVDHYLTLYHPLVLFHCFHCYLVKSVHCLSVPHTVPYVVSLSVCTLLSSTVCPLSVSTSHYTVRPFCFHCCLLEYVHSLSVPHTLLSFGSVSLCLLLSSKVHCLSEPHTIPSTGCVQCCLLQSAHCLSVLHTVTYFGSFSTALFYCLFTVSQYFTLYSPLVLHPLLSSTVCPLSVFCTALSAGSVSTAVFYSLSTVCQYFALYCPPVLYPLLSTTVCPLSVSILHCTVRWFCIHCCLLQSVHSLSVRHTPFSDCRPSADCTAAVTPSATSQRQL